MHFNYRAFSIAKPSDICYKLGFLQPSPWRPRMITSLRRWLLIAGLLAAPALTMAQGQTLRWAAQNDILTLDPHSQNHATTNNIMSHSYETLVTYDKNYKPQPALATSWSQVNANTMRFNLRRNVKFHDGSPFTADDVIFSYERSKAPPSTMTIYVGGVKEIRKIDDHTIDVVSDGANPVLLNSFTYFFIMNKAWAVKNKTEKVQNYSAKEENYASRNTNVTDVIYTPIKSDPTRVAALIAGDVDAVTDLPTQDVPRLRTNNNLFVLDGPEVRTIFIVLDLGSNELKYGPKGPNPFKDLRVRQALNMSVDRVGIQRTIMRGLSIPAALMVAPGVNGYEEGADKPVAVNVEGAKKLLAEAGFPNGFEFTLDCPNNRYVNDEEICQALVNMWARIGVKVKLNAMPFATFAAKFQAFDSSAYMLGWGVATYDAQYTLQSLIRTRSGGADGNFNFGRISHPPLDALVDRMKNEGDTLVRNRVIREALAMTRDEVLAIPLHHQMRPWAMKKNITMVHNSNDAPKMFLVTKK
jgi:peptide/nickel transport system substrate-binding protein